MYYTRNFMYHVDYMYMCHVRITGNVAVLRSTNRSLGVNFGAILHEYLDDLFLSGQCRDV